MPLTENLEKRGEWLFRWRSFLPLVIVPFAIWVTLHDDAQPIFNDLSWLSTCFLISFLGQTIRALTIGYVPKGTSGRNTGEGQVAMTLNTKGMYSLVRHPLYLGNYFMWFGIMLYAGSPIFMIYFSLAFLLYYSLIAMAEEKFLKEKFGDIYTKWAVGIPAFIPRRLIWTHPGVFFSFKNALKREYNGVFAVVVSFATLDIAHNYRELEEIIISDYMQIILGVSAVCFLIMRTIKKRTQWLDVDGREYTKNIS
jgi:protein-S-isoprenylcysteine O-methyltransferase Ste14